MLRSKEHYQRNAALTKATQSEYEHARKIHKERLAGLTKEEREEQEERDGDRFDSIIVGVERMLGCLDEDDELQATRLALETVDELVDMMGYGASRRYRKVVGSFLRGLADQIDAPKAKEKGVAPTSRLRMKKAVQRKRSRVEYFATRNEALLEARAFSGGPLTPKPIRNEVSRTKTDKWFVAAYDKKARKWLHLTIDGTFKAC